MILRVRPETHDRLRNMAREAGQTIPEFLEGVIKDFERRQFLEGANADYARLHGAPTTWTAEMEERMRWTSAFAVDDLNAAADMAAACISS